MKPEHKRAFDDGLRSLKTALLVERIGPSAYAARVAKQRESARRMRKAAALRRSVMGPQECALARLGRVEYDRIRAQGRERRKHGLPPDVRDCPYRRWTAQFHAWCLGARLQHALMTRRQYREWRRKDANGPVVRGTLD